MAGPWSSTVHVVAIKENFYTIDKAGQLSHWTKSSNQTTNLGPPQWLSTKHLLTDGTNLVSLDKDGHIYRVGFDGTWQKLKTDFSSAMTQLATASNGVLYLLDKSGQINRVDIKTGEAKKIGKPVWKNMRILMAGTVLYAVDQDTLYQINPETGAWKQVGATGEWKTIPVATVIGHRVFSTDVHGQMWETDGQTGKSRKLNAPILSNPQKMFYSNNKIFIVYGDGMMEHLRL